MRATLAGMSKISVFLDPQMHKAAKVAAMNNEVSLSQWVADLIAKQIARIDKRKQAVA